MSNIMARPEEMRAKAQDMIAQIREHRASHDRMMSIVKNMGTVFNGKLPTKMLQNILSMKEPYANLYQNADNNAQKIIVAANQYEEVDKESAQKAQNVIDTSNSSSEFPDNSSGFSLIADKSNNNETTLNWLTPPINDAEIDSFNGVPAYVNEKNFTAAQDGSYYSVGYTNGERNCAEYVKRYYKELYGMAITNLIPGGHPSGLEMTSTPKPGDVINTMVDGTSHWAIVKEIKDGDVIVIEQNTVYKSGEGFAVKVNNAYPINGSRFFTLPSK